MECLQVLAVRNVLLRLATLPCREQIHANGQNCFATPTFLGVPNRNWTKSELATSPLSSWGPKGGRYCYVTLACSGVPQKGGQNQNWHVTPAFSGAQKRAELLRNPCVLGGAQKGGTNMAHFGLVEKGPWGGP